jgi:hypothetical protein
MIFETELISASASNNCGRLIRVTRVQFDVFLLFQLVISGVIYRIFEQGNVVTYDFSLTFICCVLVSLRAVYLLLFSRIFAPLSISVEIFSHANTILHHIYFSENTSRSLTL